MVYDQASRSQNTSQIDLCSTVGGASDRYGPAKKYFGNDKLLSTCFKMKIQSSKVKYFGGVNM